jgi:hypothetical protein
MAGACGPVPRAFKPEHKDLSNAFQPLDDIAGLVVAPVAGLPVEITDPLTEQMVKSFHKMDIPASSSTTHRGGHLLKGKARLSPAGGVRRHLRIEWRLNDKSGQEIGKTTTRHSFRSRAWDEADKAILQHIVMKTVPEIASILRTNPNHTIPVKAPASVAITAIKGAPGDGGKTLPIALRTVLRQAGFAVKEDVSEATVTLGATVSLDSGTAKHDRVTIVWEFRDKAGKVVRRMRQGNNVPKGRLSQPWAELAYVVALAMRDGVRETLAALPSSSENSMPIAGQTKSSNGAADKLVPKAKTSPTDSVDALLFRLENTQILAPKRNELKGRGERLLQGLEQTRIDFAR